MKRAIYKGIKDISIENYNKPKVTEKDILVKVMRNGICGSDLHAYNLGGDEIGIYKGAAIGHEFVGEVAEIGNDVKGIHVGDHVFINPSIAKAKPGMLAMAGGLSQYDLIQNAKLNWNVFELDKSLSWDRASVIEPYSVGIHGKNLVDPKPTKNYVILGAGPVGLGAASGLYEQGCRNVVIIDIAEDRLAFAQNKLHIDILNPNQVDLYKKLEERFGTTAGLLGDPRLNVDAFIDCVGLPQYMNDFIGKAKMDSIFVVVALGSKEVSFKPQFLAMNELSLVGSAIYNADDILEAISNIENSDNNFPDIVSAHYPLEKVKDAFERANNDKNIIKVIIDVNEQ